MTVTCLMRAVSASAARKKRYWKGQCRKLKRDEELAQIHLPNAPTRWKLRMDPRMTRRSSQHCIGRTHLHVP